MLGAQKKAGTRPAFKGSTMLSVNYSVSTASVASGAIN